QDIGGNFWGYEWGMDRFNNGGLALGGMGRTPPPMFGMPGRAEGANATAPMQASALALRGPAGKQVNGKSGGAQGERQAPATGPAGQEGPARPDRSKVSPPQ